MERSMWTATLQNDSIVYLVVDRKGKEIEIHTDWRDQFKGGASISYAVERYYQMKVKKLNYVGNSAHIKEIMNDIVERAETVE